MVRVEENVAVTDRMFALFLFSVAASVTPGPTTSSPPPPARNSGFRRTLPQMPGVAVGFPLLEIAVGLGQVFTAVPAPPPALKVAGAVYLLSLACPLLKAAAPDTCGAQGGESAPTFRPSAAFQRVNPTARTTALSVIPAFVRPDAEVLPQVLLVAAMFMATSVPSLAVWALSGVALSRMLSEEKLRRGVNALLAALVVLSIILLFIWAGRVCVHFRFRFSRRRHKRDTRLRLSPGYAPKEQR